MSKDLTQGNIGRSIFDLAWPMGIGLIAVIGFNLVDTYFVGQLGTKELAAMSMTFPVVTLIGSFSYGFSIAVSSLISREFGAKNFSKVKEIATDSMIVSVGVVFVLTIAALLTIEPVFKLMGAEGKTLELIKDYMWIWYFNMFFVILPMAGNGALRGTGDTKTPALIMIVAGLVNLVLDPLLIFGWGPFPRMELEGAALATVISRIFTLAAALYVLIFKEKLIVVPNCKYLKENAKKLGAIALPAATGNAIVPLAMFVITAFITEFGEKVVAGFGVGTRIQALFTIPIIAVAAAFSPFAGQNDGAGNISRIDKGFKLGCLSMFVWITICTLFVFTLGPLVISQFNDEPAVQLVADQYLRIITTSMFFMAVLLNVNSVFNAVGRAKTSLMFSVFRMILLYVPLAFWLRSIYQAQGVFMAGALSNFCAGVLAFVVFRKYLKEKSV